MKRFKYIDAKTVDEAVSVLEETNSAILAGGTDIVNLMKTGAYENPPEYLVNIKNIPGLNAINEDDKGLTIGACVKLSDVSSSAVIKEKFPCLARAAGLVASPPLREMGTIAGNICQEVQCWYFRRSFLTGNFFNCARKGGKGCFAPKGDNRYHAIIGGKKCFCVCQSDTAVALTAMDAVIITSKRSMPIADLFGVMGNSLDKDEIITGIHLPVHETHTMQDFVKFTLRPSIDFALVSVAVALTLDNDKISDARIVLGAVAPVPYRPIHAEKILIGSLLNKSTAESAAGAAIKEAVPLSCNEYKIQIAHTLVKRALLKGNHKSE